VAGLLFVSGDTPGGDASSDGVARLPTLARKARRILANPFEDSSYGCDADAIELQEDFWRHGQLAVIVQELGHPWKSRGESLSTEEVQGLPYDPDGIVHLRAVATSPLLAPRLAIKITVHEPDEALAMESDSLLHLVQELGPTGAIGSHVPFLHDLQVLATLIDSHLGPYPHRSLR
jgi:hypothetical protein